MEDGHKYKFGQMPTIKMKFEGDIYRRLEIGEVISLKDLIDVESGHSELFYYGMTKELEGQRYNPIREHKYLIIWRKEE